MLALSIVRLPARPVKGLRPMGDLPPARDPAPLREGTVIPPAEGRLTGRRRNHRPGGPPSPSSAWRRRGIRPRPPADSYGEPPTDRHLGFHA